MKKNYTSEKTTKCCNAYPVFPAREMVKGYVFCSYCGKPYPEMAPKRPFGEFRKSRMKRDKNCNIIPPDHSRAAQYSRGELIPLGCLPPPYTPKDNRNIKIYPPQIKSENEKVAEHKIENENVGLIAEICNPETDSPEIMRGRDAFGLRIKDRILSGCRTLVSWVQEKRRKTSV